MIVVADLHLGNTGSTILRDGVPVRDTDVLNRLREAKEAAKKDDGKLVIAGDFGHRPEIPNESRAVIFSFLSECRGEVDVCVMPGNHDADSVSTASVLFEAAKLPGVWVSRSPEVLQFGAFKFLTLPHVPRRVYENIVKSYGSYCVYASSIWPEADFVIGHGMVENLGYANDVFFEAADAVPVDVTAFPFLKLAILGHIHGRWELNTSSGGRVLYPGSVATNNFGEIEEEKGYLKVSPDLSTEWFPWQTDETTYFQISIDLCNKSPDDVAYEKIAAFSDGAAVKVSVLAPTDVIVPESRIRKAVNSTGTVVKFEIQRVRSQTLPGEDALDEYSQVASVNHRELLETWIKEKKLNSKVSKMALVLGNRIMDDVFGGEA